MKDPIFKTNPRLKHYFKTADGNAFFKEHDAKNHATSLKSKKVEKVERPLVAEKTKDAPKDKNGTGKQLTSMQKAKLRIEAIEKMETVEAIEKALKNETARTVIEAGKNKIAAITANNKVEAQEVDDTNVDNATYEELMLFVNDNEVALDGKNIDDVRNAVRAYLADPNKKTVPFKGYLN